MADAAEQKEWQEARESLGQVASFLLPSVKLKSTSPSGRTFQDEIHTFLMSHFSGYTVASGNISGYWKDRFGRDLYGEHREYKVALQKAELGLALEHFLVDLAKELGEQCIYLEIGGQAWLLYQKSSSDPNAQGPCA